VGKEKLMNKNIEYPVKEHPDYWSCEVNGCDWEAKTVEEINYDYYRCKRCGRCVDHLESRNFVD